MVYMRRWHFVAVVMLALDAKAVRIENVPRGIKDNPNDAHDGSIVQWTPGGLYYRYAMAYTSCTMNSGQLSWLYAGSNWFISNVAGAVASCSGFACAPIMFHRFGVDCGFLTAAQGQTVKVWTSADLVTCLLYTSPSPRDQRGSRMPSSA